MAQVTFTPNHVPPPACYPSDINGLLDSLTTGGGLSGTIPDQAGGGVFVGSAPPPSALANKVWYKIDGAGRPLGVYMFYNGNWRKVYMSVGLGEIRMWFGASAGIFDGTGRGIISGDMDGWALCNGNNGTPNLQDLFIVASGIFNNGWISQVEGGNQKLSGGQRGPWTLQYNQIPPLHAEVFTRLGAGIGNNGPEAYVGGPSDSQTNFWPIHENKNLQQVPMAFPPYIALAFIMFVGYQ